MAEPEVRANNGHTRRRIQERDNRSHNAGQGARRAATVKPDYNQPLHRQGPDKKIQRKTRDKRKRKEHNKNTHTQSQPCPNNPLANPTPTPTKNDRQKKRKQQQMERVSSQNKI